MTTNVYDGGKRTLATDSRWSVTYGKYVIYVDDMQFDKIELYKDTAFMFAGRGRGIQQWKDWIRSEPSGPQNMPPVEGIAVCVVHMPSGDVKFAEKQDIVKDGGYFTGSGARHAYLCWDRNRDAVKSVETAKCVDPCSGGQVKFVHCEDGRHNLCHPSSTVTIDMVDRAIETRGEVMEIAKPGNPIPFKEAAANDAELRDVQAKLANGQISVEAPCDQMYNAWTEEEKSKLTGVLKEVFGW